jgi:hypothetical protein
MLISSFKVGTLDVVDVRLLDTRERMQEVSNKVNSTWLELTQTDVGCTALGQSLDGDIESMLFGVYDGDDFQGAWLMGCIYDVGTFELDMRMMPALDGMANANERAADIAAAFKTKTHKTGEGANVTIRTLRYELVSGRSGPNDIRAEALHAAMLANPQLNITESTDTFQGRKRIVIE